MHSITGSGAGYDLLSCRTDYIEYRPFDIDNYTFIEKGIVIIGNLDGKTIPENVHNRILEFVQREPERFKIDSINGLNFRKHSYRLIYSFETNEQIKGIISLFILGFCLFFCCFRQNSILIKGIRLFLKGKLEVTYQIESNSRLDAENRFLGCFPRGSIVKLLS